MPDQRFSPLHPLIPIILCLLCASVSAGCTAAARTAKYTNPHSFDVRPVHKDAQIVVVWSARAPGLSPFGSFPTQFAGIAYLPGSDSIVVPTMGGDLMRYRAANGELAWSVSFDYAFSAAPAVFNQNLYLPTLQGYLLALTDANASEVWRAKADNSLEGTPAANSDVVVALDAEDVLYCWNRTDGSERWRFENERSKNFTIKGASTPILTDKTAIVGFAGGEIASFDLQSGEKLWSLDVSGGESEFADVDLIQATSNGTFIAASRAGGVFSIEQSTGRVLWKAPYKSISALAVTPSLVLIGTTSNRVIALTHKGKPKWSFKTKAAIPTSMVVYGHYVVVGTGQGPIYLLDAANGFPHQRWDGLRGAHAPLTFGGERIYMQDDTGEIYTLKVGW